MKQDLFRCQMVVPFRAPKQVSGDVVFKVFPEGKIFEASPHNGALLPNNHVPSFKTKDGYIIPITNINVLGKLNSAQSRAKDNIPMAEIVDETAKASKQHVEKFAAASGGFKAKNFVDLQNNKSKASVNGAMIGVALGICYALVTKKNKWMFASIGAIGGYAAGNVYSSFKQKTQ